MCIEVTRYAELKERRMVSHNASEGFSPEICLVALDQEVHHSEASIAAHEQGECVSGGPGSQTIAGHSTVHSGTRESHVVLKRSLHQAEEARRGYGGMAVGPVHIRGVGGVMRPLFACNNNFRCGSCLTSKMAGDMVGRLFFLCCKVNLDGKSLYLRWSASD